MHNVFLIKPKLEAEDRFTAHWVCLLGNHPEIAQSVVNQLAKSIGLTPSRILEVIDHPRGWSAERPDCLLRTEDYDILCEHKLNSPLGKNQLERYLALASSKKSYLALIANQTISVPDAVLQNPHYLWPKERQSHGHFLWQDFYHLTRQSRGMLVRQFREYMDSLGMNPWSWGTFGDPFTDVEAAQRFRDLYEPIVAKLRSMNISAVRRSNSLGLQIRYPVEEVPLLYVTPTQWDGSLDLPLSGRLMHATAWVKGQKRIFPEVDCFLKNDPPRTFVSALPDVTANWREDLYAELSFHSGLDDILVRNPKSSSENLAAVILGVIDYLKSNRVKKPPKKK